MSHFTVLVALSGSVEARDVYPALEQAMAPYDENLAVEPYRDYEEGGPEDHWFVSSVRRAVRDRDEGTGIKPYNPQMMPGSCYSTATSESRGEDR